MKKGKFVKPSAEEYARDLGGRLAANLRKRRGELAMSQQTLAKAAGIGRRNLQRYEEQQASPSVRLLARLSFGLNTTADTLLA